jgi:dTDP-4-amino-4,6-dideoxygalactose transaminase
MSAAPGSPIPLVDLGWQHRQIADEVTAGLADVFEQTSFINGPPVASFETEFAALAGTRRCVGVANGTDAVELALRSVGIGRDDVVVVPANTFIASAEAIVRAGARPVLVDCDPVHQLIDVDAAVAAVEAHQARAVLGVDLFGQCAPFTELADRLGDRLADGTCTLVEDAAQSQGATHAGGGIGAVAAIAATSFYPGKNLGAYGDAGAVVTNRDDLADTVRLLGDHGSRVRYQHEIVGMNSRLDTVQAVVLRAKLRRLPEWNEQRRAAADRYLAALSDVDGVGLPSTRADNEHVWHLFVVRVAERDRVLGALQAAGVGAGIHYPVPIHLQPAFASLGHRPGDFPHAEAAASEILSLPIFPGITVDQQDRVVAELLAALSA